MALRRIIIDNIEYFARPNPRGYGYEILKKYKVGDRINYGIIFNSYNKELVSSYMDRFMNGEVVNDFPDTSNEEPTETKILIYKSKHYTSYYDVSTMEKLKKTFRHILKDEYSKSIDNMCPINNIINDSGVKSQDEIDSIPVEDVKKSVQIKWNEYQNKLKKFNYEKQEYDNLRLVVKEDKGNEILAFEIYECDYYDIERLTVL